MLLLLSVLLTTGRADTFGDFTYTTTATSASITGYTGPGGNITIPDFIGDKPVTSIGFNGFANCTSVTGIEVSTNMTSFGPKAFFNCSSLTNISIPASVRTIGYPFDGCTSLLAITVDPLNTAYCSIDGVLFDKGQTTLIKVPAAGIRDYVIPNSVTRIDSSAFSGAASLTNVTIPDSVTAIGVNAFQSCLGLKNIIIPNSVVQIGNVAFSGCTGLTNLSISTNILTLSSNVFANCTSLTDFVIPNRVTTIGYGALAGCTALTNVRISSAVTTIDKYAFSNCNSLSSLTIPINVRTVNSYTFDGCSNLLSLYFQGNAPMITPILGQLYINDKEVTIYYRPGTAGWSSTFAGHQTATWLDPNAQDFVYQQNGSTITITDYAGPGGAATIPDTIFDEVVNKIGASAFASVSNLTSLSIPGSVTNIGSSAFAGCPNLTSIIFMGNAPSIVPANIFNNTTNVTVYYRAGTTGWSSTFAGQPTALWIEQPTGDFEYSITNSFVTITKYVGPGGNVTIPDKIEEVTVTSLGESAFSDCTSLTNITIPMGVTNIGDAAFRDCKGLSSITIPNSVTTIGETVFYGCSGLTNLILPENLTSLEYNVFFGCTGLTSITIPNSVKSIAERAFMECSGLTNVTILNGVLNIGEAAFSLSTNLTSVKIGYGVTNMEPAAFVNCFNLKDLYFAGNAPAYDTNFDLFTYAPNVTVYYRAGTTGWGTTFSGRPTALWTPAYQEWALIVGLPELFPDSSAENNDPDHDGMTNFQEMQAGTDPTKPGSKLAFESAPRLSDLVEDDKTAVGSSQHALYFQTVPGKQYEIQAVTTIAGTWQTITNLTATTTQKRVLINKPIDQEFYRLILVP